MKDVYHTHRNNRYMNEKKSICISPYILLFIFILYKKIIIYFYKFIFVENMKRERFVFLSHLSKYLSYCSRNTKG